MSRVPYPAATSQDYFSGSSGGDFAEDFVLGERIGTPGERRRGSSMRDAIGVVGMLLAAAWVIGSLPTAWTSQIWNGLASAYQSTQQSATAAPAPPPVVPAPIESAREVVAAPGADAGTAVPAPAEAGPAANAAQMDAAQADAGADKASAPVDDRLEAANARLPAPVADPDDPLQKRALAAGLHPGISRAVLARLSSADFRAAHTAIETALAGKAALGEAIVVPKDAKGGRAQFEVRFVEAAAAECRRYVVTIIKDRWSTTAPAMETCGSRSSQRTSARQGARAASN